MRRIFVITFIIIIVVSLLIWLMPDQTNSASAEINKLQNQNTTQQASQTQIQEKIEESIARRKLSKLDPDRLKSAIANTEIFQTTTVEEVRKNNPIQLHEQQQQDGRAYIQYDLYGLEAKSSGDQVDFKADELGLERTAVITRVKTDPEQDIVTWSGYLTNGDKNNETFRISQALNDNYAIGQIRTIDGTYEIEVKNGYGWISPDQAYQHDEMASDDHSH